LESFRCTAQLSANGIVRLLAKSNPREASKELTRHEPTTFVSWLPLYHDMGLIGAWLSSLYFGIPLVVMAPLAFLTRPSGWLNATHADRATISAGPNFAYELCLTKIDDAER